MPLWPNMTPLYCGLLSMPSPHRLFYDLLLGIEGYIPCCHNILLLLLLYHLSSQYPQLKYVISTNVCYQLLKITVFPLININIRIDGQYISKVKCIYRFYLDIYRIVQVLNVQRSYGHSVLVQIVFHFSGLSSTILSQILHNYVDCVESSRRPWGRPCQNSLC